MLKSFLILILLLYSYALCHLHVNIRDGRGIKHLYNVKLGNSAKPKDNEYKMTFVSSLPTMSSHSVSTDDMLFYKSLPSVNSFISGFSKNIEAISKNSWIFSQLKNVWNYQIPKEASTKQKEEIDINTNFQNISETSFSQALPYGYTIPLLELSTECLSEKHDLPYGLCYRNNFKGDFDKQILKKYAHKIIENGKLPHWTGKKIIDMRVAFGIVLLNCGFLNRSIDHFTRLLKDYPTAVLPYYGRALAYIRKDIKNLGQNALNDLSAVIKLNKKLAESWERRGELQFLSGKLVEAHNDVSQAVSLKPTWRNLYVRGTLHFLLESLELAEADFRAALRHRPDARHLMLQLALTMYFRGQVRGAILLLHEILEHSPNHPDTLACLAQAYTQVGDVKKAKENYRKLLEVPEVSSSQRLSAYHSLARLSLTAGRLHETLNTASQCLKLQPQHTGCLYLRASAFTALGQFYAGIKTATALMVQWQSSAVRMSPEFLRIHYLREWSRLVHSKLEHPSIKLNLSGSDLGVEYRDKWVKGQALDDVPHYTEQPGLQPKIPDVKTPAFSSYSYIMQKLLCKVQSLGRLFKVSSDGHINNERVLFAMGLATLHTSQTVERYWKNISALSSTSNSKMPPPLQWKRLLETAVRYQGLAEPDAPALLLTDMAEHHLEEGYTSEKTLLRGQSKNIKLSAYFDLVFQLVKTMAEHSSTSPTKDAQREIAATDCPTKLIEVAKRHGAFHPNAGGVLVVTQVPSTKYKASLRHDGAMIALSEDTTGQQQPVLSLNLLTTRPRLVSYSEELDFLMAKLTDEVMRRGGVTAVAASATGSGVSMEELVDSALQLHYYICNAGVVAHQPGLVAYSVALGVLLALGLEARGPVPPGKLLELEPLLAGTPEAFVLVTKQWLKVGAVRGSVTSLPDLEKALPTVRHVLEAVAASSGAKCTSLNTP